MQSRKGLYLGAAAILGALLVGLMSDVARARTVSWLYGEALRVANPYEQQSGTPDVTLAAGGAYIQGTLEVDGASRLDGATALNGAVTLTSSLASTGASIAVSSGTSAGATAANFVGAYTSTQLASLSGQSGKIALNITVNAVCIGTGTTATNGAYIYLSTSSTSAARPCL